MHLKVKDGMRLQDGVS